MKGEVSEELTSVSFPITAINTCIMFQVHYRMNFFWDQPEQL